MKLPIVVGVTGHRDLRQSDIPKLQELVTDELHKLIEQYPNSEFILLDSIASGADTLCAEVALALGMKLVCPLPMPADEYRKDFSEPEAIVFDALLQKATNVFVAPASEPLPDTLSRDFHYRQAGIYAATHSHVLIALWDGTPAKTDGCGTAEAVDFMLKGSYKGRVGFRAVNDGAVLHILTPRQSGAGTFTILSRLLKSESGSLHEVLHMTDAFNADLAITADDSSQPDTLLTEESLNHADEN